MTPEVAEYYRAMLTVGIRDKLDAAFDQALEMEEPLSDLILSLCNCISDDAQVLSVLYNYTVNYKLDEQVVCDLILADLRSRYIQGELKRADITYYLYKIVINLDKFWKDPWRELTWTSDDLELFEDGYISEEIFNQCFDAWLLRGEHLASWMLEKRMKQK